MFKIASGISMVVLVIFGARWYLNGGAPPLHWVVAGGFWGGILLVIFGAVSLRHKDDDIKYPPTSIEADLQRSWTEYQRTNLGKKKWN